MLLRLNWPSCEAIDHCVCQAFCNVPVTTGVPNPGGLEVLVTNSSFVSEITNRFATQTDQGFGQSAMSAVLIVLGAPSLRPQDQFIRDRRVVVVNRLDLTI